MCWQIKFNYNILYNCQRCWTGHFILSPHFVPCLPFVCISLMLCSWQTEILPHHILEQHIFLEEIAQTYTLFFSLSFWGWLSVWLIQIVASLKEARIEAGMYHGQMCNKAREDSHRYVIIIFIFLISTQHRFCFLKWLLFLFILLLDLTM